MSRAYKRKLTQLAANAGVTGTANFERLSGADIAQVMLAREQEGTVDVATNGNKSLGTSSVYGGRNNAALSGGDLETHSGDA